jgi:uncharacterized protein
MRRILLMLSLCSLIMSCQHSPQKNYYYLSAIQPIEKNITPISNSNITQVIGIGPIELADYLNRSQIIDNQTDNILKMTDNAYWAEPLDKAIPRVLALNLTQLNNTRSFVNFPWRMDSKPQYSLRVQIYELTRKGDTASLNANWELVDNETKNTLIRRHFFQTTNAESNTKALAQAYSKLLAELAGEMDQALNQTH